MIETIRLRYPLVWGLGLLAFMATAPLVFPVLSALALSWWILCQVARGILWLNNRFSSQPVSARSKHTSPISA